jgi:hypothetical protein
MSKLTAVDGCEALPVADLFCMVTPAAIEASSMVRLVSMVLASRFLLLWDDDVSSRRLCSAFAPVDRQ